MGIMRASSQPREVEIVPNTAALKMICPTWLLMPAKNRSFGKDRAIAKAEEPPVNVQEDQTSRIRGADGGRQEAHDLPHF